MEASILSLIIQSSAAAGIVPVLLALPHHAAADAARQ
jgi:hypothetical protein